MEPRIHRSNMPVYLREDIEPMQPYRRHARTISNVITKSALIGAALVVVAMLAPIIAGHFA